MSEPAAPPPKVERQAPRWMRNLLIVSLGLNLLTVGLIASAAWHMRHAPAFGIQGRLSTFVENLPAERSAALRGTVEQARPSLRPLRQEARKARREAADLFVADPFDKEKYIAAQERLLEAELRVRRAHLQLITTVAGQLTLEERKALLKWREQRWHRAPRTERNADTADGRSERKSP